MLAGQRLRRAATYAADRTLLRRLIEQVEPQPTPEPAPQPVAEPVAIAGDSSANAPLHLPEPIERAAPPLASVIAPEPVLAAAPPIEVAVIAPAPEPVMEVLAPLPVVAVAPQVSVAIADTAAQPAALVTAAEVTPEALPTVPEAVPEAVPELPTIAPPLPAVLVVEEEPEAIAPPLPLVPAIPEPDTLPATNLPETSHPEANELANLVELEGAVISPSIPVAEAELEAILVPEPTDEEADLPAQAPAIRPPVEVGEARFEFGLAEPPAPVVPTYELPGLIDEWAASAVTLSLGSPDALAEAHASPPIFTPAAFTGDAIIGYAFGESSRLGLSMQLLDLLAAQAEAAEAATAVIAAAQPPAVALPPTGTFFEPDPLLLDHWATYCPPPPALPSSLDLINNFLKRQPRLTRPAMLPPAPGGQADLSVRSTRAEPDLVSENLARIFVRQGKIVRAIEIYEKLMVKHPEKMAYFALQIQSLQPSA